MYIHAYHVYVYVYVHAYRRIHIYMYIHIYLFAPDMWPLRTMYSKHDTMKQVTRRSALGILSVSTLVAYVKIYGESEESLRLYDKFDDTVRRITGRSWRNMYVGVCIF